MAQTSTFAYGLGSQRGRFMQDIYSPAMKGRPYSPIPRRASAHPSVAVKRRFYLADASQRRASIYQDITRMPTAPDPCDALPCQHDARLGKNRTFNLREVACADQDRSERDQLLVEIPTQPTQKSAQYIDEIPTQEMHSKTVLAENDRQVSFSAPLLVKDRIRWWLLYPGRLEFILWSLGAIFLVCMTAGLGILLALALGFLDMAH
ncbi:MAG TPA: hypothetical protein VL461_02140 [Dictyobacter sp.]|jgi:hypothetical protein|nr:hypothetical protein [Dictyobacter sp.]